MPYDKSREAQILNAYEPELSGIEKRVVRSNKLGRFLLDALIAIGSTYGTTSSQLRYLSQPTNPENYKID